MFCSVTSTKIKEIVVERMMLICLEVAKNRTHKEHKFDFNLKFRRGHLIRFFSRKMEIGQEKEGSIINGGGHEGALYESSERKPG